MTDFRRYVRLMSELENLDFDSDTLRLHLQAAGETIIRLYGKLDSAPITPNKTRAEIASLFDAPLPEDPERFEDVLEKIEHHIFANSTLYLTPRFMGYINSGGNHVAIVAELLAAAINQIPAKWHFAPAASEVERRLVRWIADFIRYSPDAGGCLVSGGSAGHMVALELARNKYLPNDVACDGMYGMPKATVYVSEEGHVSIDRAMVSLGLGKHQLRKIRTSNDFRIDIDALETQLVKDRSDGNLPICVVGNAGTTNTGAVDPLDELANVCRRNDVWFHVDGAYGAPAASTEIAGHLFRGLELAEPVILNPHKWLYAPVEAACILVRDPRAMRSAFNLDAEYLEDTSATHQDGRFDYKDYNPQLSRSFKALKVWMAFKIYGATRLRESITNNISVMQYLRDRLEAADDFICLAPVPLSIVCFQYRTSEPATHNDRVYLNSLNAALADALEKDGRTFISRTTIRGNTVLRACSVNHRLRYEDADSLIEVLRDVAKGLTSERIRSRVTTDP